MRHIYKEIEKILDRINFTDIWLGYKRYDFALYNDKKVYLKDRVIDRDDRFLGNTGIEYEDAYLAIWYIDDLDNIDLDLLASNLCHEMFHCYQLDMGEKRFPNELKGLDYPDIEDNYQLKYLENKLIVEILDSEDRNVYDLFKRFIDLKSYRYRIFGDELLYEFKIELCEGTAEYVGLKALLKLSREKYVRQLENYKKEFLKLDMLFDIRRSSYYGGVLTLLILEKMNIEIDRTFDNLSTYNEILIERYAEDKDIIFKGDEELSRIFIETNEDKKRKILDFKSKQLEQVKGEFLIAMYDPMNMFKYNNEILHSHFVGLRDSKGEMVLLKEEVMTVLEEDSLNKLATYYRIK